MLCAMTKAIRAPKKKNSSCHRRKTLISNHQIFMYLTRILRQDGKNSMKTQPTVLSDAAVCSHSAIFQHLRIANSRRQPTFCVLQLMQTLSLLKRQRLSLKQKKPEDLLYAWAVADKRHHREKITELNNLHCQKNSLLFLFIQQQQPQKNKRTKVKMKLIWKAMN